MTAIFKPSKVQIYVNSKKLTATQIKAETGCDYIINGGLFEWSWKACPLLKVDGEVIADADYGAWGYAWDEGGDMTMLNTMSKRNFISCVDLINPWDGAVSKLNYQSDMGGSRPRTAMGQKADGTVVLYCDSAGKTPEQLQQIMKDYDCVSAIMLDGGGSTQGIFPSGKVESSRIVHNYLCFWEDGNDNGNEGDKVSRQIDIQYTTASDGWYNSALYVKGVMVHSTATPGVDAQTFRDKFNRSGVGASVHFFLDDKQIIQCLPTNKRAGHCAGTANGTHISIEMCEPSGIKYGSGSTITTYNPPADYFKNAYANMVWLVAKLCKEYDLDPIEDGVVICHSEGYRRGVASNHGDVEHWWNIKEGITMVKFRQDVKAAMDGTEEEEEEEMTYEQFCEYMDKYLSEASDKEPSSWAKDSCEKSVSKGIFKGDGKGNYNWHKPIDRESVATIMDRMGLMD